MKPEDFVSYEQAVKLRKLGFRWKCLFHYDDSKHLIPNRLGKGKWSKDINVGSLLERNHSNYLAVPTLAQVAKWLREKKYLNVEAIIYIDKVVEKLKLVPKTFWEANVSDISEKRHFYFRMDTR